MCVDFFSFGVKKRCIYNKRRRGKRKYQITQKYEWKRITQQKRRGLRMKVTYRSSHGNLFEMLRHSRKFLSVRCHLYCVHRYLHSSDWQILPWKSKRLKCPSAVLNVYFIRRSFRFFSESYSFVFLFVCTWSLWWSYVKSVASHSSPCQDRLRSWTWRRGMAGCQKPGAAMHDQLAVQEAVIAAPRSLRGAVNCIKVLDQVIHGNCVHDYRRIIKYLTY